MSSAQKIMIDPADGLPAMKVGAWVSEEKHQIIQRYIDSAWAARRRYRHRSYVDLYAGTGRIFTNRVGFADGGPLAAWRMAKLKPGSFTSFFIADANKEYLEACQARLNGELAPVIASVGYAHHTVNNIVNRLDKCGLHFVLLDPFNISSLHFSIIQKLSTLKRVDIVVHLSTGDIQRNIADQLHNESALFDDFAPGWRNVIHREMSKREMRQCFIEHWKGLVHGTGMRVCNTMYPVRNSRRSIMYWLCLITRHPLAEKLWHDACNLRERSLFC